MESEADDLGVGDVADVDDPRLLDEVALDGGLDYPLPHHVHYGGLPHGLESLREIAESALVESFAHREGDSPPLQGLPQDVGVADRYQDVPPLADGLAVDPFHPPPFSAMERRAPHASHWRKKRRLSRSIRVSGRLQTGQTTYFLA